MTLVIKLTAEQRAYLQRLRNDDKVRLDFQSGLLILPDEYPYFDDRQVTTNEDFVELLMEAMTKPIEDDSEPEQEDQELS